MSEPHPDEIKRLKSEFPDRSLHLVTSEVKDDPNNVMHFVMTGPTRDDIDKFDDEMMKADAIKVEGDRKKAIRKAAENAILAQTRWPDRPTTQTVLESNPEMCYRLAEKVREHAGANLEFRSKKL